MGKNSGYLYKVDTGGYAVARHREQEKPFLQLKKRFVHFLDDNFEPLIIDGKEKSGLINIDRLTVTGMYD